LLYFPGSLKFAGMQPHCQQTAYPGRRKNSRWDNLLGTPFPPVIRHSALCLFLILALLTTCLLRISDREHTVLITRNAAWNDPLDRFGTGRTQASNESVSSDLLLIQRFLQEHETEVTVAVYDGLQSCRPLTRSFSEGRQGPGNHPQGPLVQRIPSHEREVICATATDYALWRMPPAHPFRRAVCLLQSPRHWRLPVLSLPLSSRRLLGRSSE
jgi:hypothetical protein